MLVRFSGRLGFSGRIFSRGDMLRAGSGLFQANTSTETSGGMKLRRSLLTSAALVLAGASLALAGAALAPAGAAIGAPLPPRRPPEFNPPTTVKTAPQTAPVAPAAPQSATAPSGRSPADVNIETLQPYNLPPASRQKMRQCGEEWRKLKMAGRSSGLVWRSFAEKCLVR
jgi:hypothetical protein